MADTTATCTICNKKFLIIDQELEFLKKKNLALPTLCPTHRQERRLVGRGERTLFKTTCQECNASMVTSYDPSKATSKILCKTCYLSYFEKNDPLLP